LTPKIISGLIIVFLGAAALLLFGIFIASLLPPAIVLEPSRLTFGAEDKGAGTPPQSATISIQNRIFGARRVRLWRAMSKADWLTVRPRSGRGGGSLELKPIYRRLAPGTHRTTVMVACPGVTNSPQEIKVIVNVYEKGSSAPPFGWLDYPADGQTVRGDSVEVWGWALDDIAVQDVLIKRSPFSEESPGLPDSDGLIYVGRAKFLQGVRPDVEKAFGGFPLNSRAAWWLNFPLDELASDHGRDLTIHAVAIDVEGKSRLVKSTTVQVAR
jgi:hypothetical protein